jgi:hypothetical protein
MAHKEKVNFDLQRNKLILGYRCGVSIPMLDTVDCQ